MRRMQPRWQRYLAAYEEDEVVAVETRAHPPRLAGVAERRARPLPEHLARLRREEDRAVVFPIRHEQAAGPGVEADCRCVSG